jgi:hypothetical protein
VGNDTAAGVYRRSVGRRGGASETVTEKDLIDFEEAGVECWKLVEEMRQEWEAILDKEEAQEQE